MTEIERKALAILEEITDYTCREISDANFDDICAALRRAIEQHEAYKQEVSDEIVKMGCWPDTVYLQRFILPKPVDPLVEAVAECDDGTWETKAEYANKLRAAIEKRGGKIVWGEG